MPGAATTNSPDLGGRLPFTGKLMSPSGGYPGRVRSCSGWHALGWPIVRPQGSWLPSTLCGHLSRTSHPPSACSWAAAIRALMALSTCSSYTPVTVASLCCGLCISQNRCGMDGVGGADAVSTSD